ncbi:MAG: DUF86 domain-containing protein [Armatimonadetes bacterium]|nr:DUF86 domain-containing protein [Armatimonadota bacterium]
MNRDELYLTHIADAIAYIREDSASGREHFLRDRRTQQLVFHNLQIIGEAVKGLSPETRQAAPHVPWTKIAGLRNELVHNYDGIDAVRIWDVIERRLPDLETAVNALLMIVRAANDKGDADPTPGD